MRVAATAAPCQSPLTAFGLALRRQQPWRLAAAPADAKCELEYTLAVHRGVVPNAVEVTKLVALCFAEGCGDLEAHDHSLPPRPHPMFQLVLLMTMQWQASTLGANYLTVLATHPESGEVTGVANVTPGLEQAGADGHELAGLPAGTAVAALSNVAVAPAHRRRGLGRRLVAACEAAAAQQLAAAALALAVYRTNLPAVALYQSCGYAVDGSWVDPRWAESAERGRVTWARRQLMAKPLPGGAAQAGDA